MLRCTNQASLKRVCSIDRNPHSQQIMGTDWTFFELADAQISRSLQGDDRPFCHPRDFESGISNYDHPIEEFGR
jgi:hypothetical protein